MSDSGPTCDDVTTFFDSDVKFSKPLRKADGAVVVCGTKDRSECPSDAYCSAKYAVCCPRPCKNSVWTKKYMNKIASI